MCVETVIASGDWSGESDTAALRAAEEKLTKPASQRNTGIIMLDGQFMVNEPLTFGTEASCPIALHSASHSQISWVGPATDAPMLTFCASRQAHSRACMLQNVLVNCQRKKDRCSGVVFRDLPHHLLMQNSEVLWWRGVGVDAVNCWCSGLRDSTILAGNGVALRATDFNEGYLQGLTVQGTDDYWPADLPADQRAGIVLFGRGILAQSIELEGSRYGDYPLIYASTCRSEFDGLWLESTVNTRAKIVLHSDGKPPGVCEHVTISRVDGTAGGKPGSCRAFLELRGVSRDITVRDSYLTQLGESVVFASDGQHSGTRIERVETAHNTVPADRLWRAAAGATLTHLTR